MIDRQRKLLELIADNGPVTYRDLIYHKDFKVDEPTGVALDLLDTDLDYLERSDLISYDRIQGDFCLTHKGTEEL